MMKVFIRMFGVLKLFLLKIYSYTLIKINILKKSGQLIIKHFQGQIHKYGMKLDAGQSIELKLKDNLR